jgi:CBS domain-containing protein
MRVRHCMTANPIVVSPGTTVAEIARLFTTYRFGCVPVVDDRGTLAGVVTKTDLFIREKVVPFSMVTAPSLMGEWVDPSHLRETYEALRDTTAENVMTRNVLTVDADAPVGHAARLMMKHGRRHLPVTTATGKLVGILTRHDVLCAFFGAARTSRAPESFAGGRRP